MYSRILYGRGRREKRPLTCNVASLLETKRAYEVTARPSPYAAAGEDV